VVNLFRQRTEPRELTHTQTEYRVVPDARRPEANEVYSVERVTVTNSAGAETLYQPLYGIQHGQKVQGARRFWYASRKGAEERRRDEATEVFVSLIDLDFRPSAKGGEYISIETTCLNRDLPSRLPFGGGQPRFQLREGSVPIDSIRCLTAPTPTLRPPLGQGARWRLISHLLLNHLSIADLDEGKHALREILALYDFKDSDETRTQIEGVFQVRSCPVNGRIPTGGLVGFCRGTEVSIDLDAGNFPGGSAFLFASVLERFLSLYCSINAFTRLDAGIRGRGRLCRWPPRPGVVKVL
jgi:type VI secretion system protein ImpG